MLNYYLPSNIRYNNYFALNGEKMKLVSSGKSIRENNSKSNLFVL